MRKSTLVDKFFPGYNCAQTIFSLYAANLGINKTLALKIASGFGSGMNCAETCGAVTGAYMVIGIKAGHASAIQDEKAHTATCVKKFNQLFIEKHKSLKCKELLGFDVSIPEENTAAKNARVFIEYCPLFLKTACDIIDDNF